MSDSNPQEIQFGSQPPKDAAVQFGKHPETNETHASSPGDTDPTLIVQPPPANGNPQSPPPPADAERPAPHDDDDAAETPPADDDADDADDAPTD